MEAPRLRGQDLAERLGAEAQRFRPEVGQLLLGCLRREQPDAGPFLRAGFGEDELGTALEAKAKGRCLWPFFAGSEVAKAPGRHQMDEQYELTVLGREEQPLASSGGTFETPSLQSCQRWIEGLQRCDVRRPGLLDPEQTHGFLEGVSPRLHLRQLGHTLPASWTRSA